MPQQNIQTEFIITTSPLHHHTLMVAAIMELLERLPIKFIFTSFFAVLLFSCENNNTANTIFIPQVFIKSTDSSLTNKQVVLCFDKKPFSGFLLDLYENGDTALLVPYFNGKEHGEAKKKFPNNQLCELRYFINGNKENEHKGYFENGKLKFILHYENDLFHGNQKEWNEQGILYHDGNYINGHEEGQQRFWRPNGKLQANYVVRNGRNYGLTGVKNCENVGDSIQ